MVGHESGPGLRLIEGHISGMGLEGMRLTVGHVSKPGLIGQRLGVGPVSGI